MLRTTPARRSSRSLGALAALLVASSACLAAAGGGAAESRTGPPVPHASRAATRPCLTGFGVVLELVSGKAAVGPEGDLDFRFPSGLAGRLSFFHTSAAAQSRTTVDDAHALGVSKLRVPYRVLNVEIVWATKTAAPSTAERTIMNGCIRQRGLPTVG